MASVWSSRAGCVKKSTVSVPVDGRLELEGLAGLSFLRCVKCSRVSAFPSIGP